jgi:hypothetical protein
MGARAAKCRRASSRQSSPPPGIPCPGGYPPACAGIETIGSATIVRLSPAPCAITRLPAPDELSAVPGGGGANGSRMTRPELPTTRTTTSSPGCIPTSRGYRSGSSFCTTMTAALGSRGLRNGSGGFVPVFNITVYSFASTLGAEPLGIPSHHRSGGGSIVTAASVPSDPNEQGPRRRQCVECRPAEGGAGTREPRRRLDAVRVCTGLIGGCKRSTRRRGPFWLFFSDPCRTIAVAESNLPFRGEDGKVRNRRVSPVAHVPAKVR